MGTIIGRQEKGGVKGERITGGAALFVRRGK